MAAQGTGANKKHVTSSKAAKITSTSLQRDDWLCFMKTLRPDLDQEFTSKLFDVMDVTQEGVIMEEEFQQLVYHFAQLQAELIAPKPGKGARVRAPSAASGGGGDAASSWRNRIAVWLVSNWAWVIFDSNVLLNSIFIVAFLGMEEHQSLDNLTPAQEVIRILQEVTLGFFLLEVVLKTVFLGPVMYFRGDRPVLAGAPKQPGVQTWNPMASKAAASPAQGIELADAKAVPGSPAPSSPAPSSAGSGEDSPLAAGEDAMSFPLHIVGLNVQGDLWNIDPVFNKLDIACAIASVAVVVLQAVNVVDPRVVIAVTLFRMLRLFRPLRFLEGFMITARSFMQVVPLLARYFFLLFATLFSFAVIGMELFSGRLVPENSQVANSAYGVNSYWVNNFDNMRNSIVVLFEQLVVNNWPIVMEGCVAATSGWARLYFIIFNQFAVLAVLSILLAFLLESFAVQREHNKKLLDRHNSHQKHAATDPYGANEIEESWACLLRDSSIDFSKWRLSRYESQGHIYEMLFKDAIQEHHSYTLSNKQGARGMLARSAHTGALSDVRRSLGSRLSAGSFASMAHNRRGSGRKTRMLMFRK